MVLEVMGRDVGWIAIAAGIAGGADVVLIPEVPVSMAKVAAKLKAVSAQGRNHALVVVAEGVRLPPETDLKADCRSTGGIVADMIAEATGAETRVTVLGHVQRGGSPNAFDRILASSLGAHAADLAARGLSDRIVIWDRGKIVDVPLRSVAGQTRALKLDGTLVETARRMGICLGD
jgi:6-phosphofructokinase 1